MSSIQAIKTDSYKSNYDVFFRDHSVFMRVSHKVKTDSFVENCQCPKVLCCDDDSFQHFVLRKLLCSLHSQKLQSTSDIAFFMSGEELLAEFERLQGKCYCGGPKIIITDFNMGEKRMNGLQLVHKLRSQGFKNSIIVRTSNNLRSLTDIDDEFEERRADQPMTLYLSKKNLKHQKEVLLQQMVEGF